MTTMLQGQGNQLPSNFPYEGQWLWENRIFLYKSSRTSPSGAELEFAAYSAGPDGRVCIGLDAMQLALGFRLSPEQVLDHNRSQTLNLVSVDDVPATKGFVEAKLLILQIGDSQVGVTVERSQQGGRA